MEKWKNKKKSLQNFVLNFNQILEARFRTKNMLVMNGASSYLSYEIRFL
jgi:hypothetical protein